MNDRYHIGPHGEYLGKSTDKPPAADNSDAGCGVIILIGLAWVAILYWQIALVLAGLALAVWVIFAGGAWLIRWGVETRDARKERAELDFVEGVVVEELRRAVGRGQEARAAALCRGIVAFALDGHGEYEEQRAYRGGRQVYIGEASARIVRYAAWEGALRVVSAALRSDDQRERAAALAAVAAVPSPHRARVATLLPGIEETLWDATNLPATRAAAARIVGALGDLPVTDPSRLPAANRPRLFDLKAAPARRTFGDSTRTGAAREHHDDSPLSDALEVLMAHTTDPDPVVRGASYQGIALCASRPDATGCAAEELLHAALTRRDASRLLAVQAVAEARLKAHLPALKRTADDEDEEPQVRAAARAAIQAIVAARPPAPEPMIAVAAIGMD